MATLTATCCTLTSAQPSTQFSINKLLCMVWDLQSMQHKPKGISTQMQALNSSCLMLTCLITYLSCFWLSLSRRCDGYSREDTGTNIAALRLQKRWDTASTPAYADDLLALILRLENLQLQAGRLRLHSRDRNEGDVTFMCLVCLLTSVQSWPCLMLKPARGGLSTAAQNESSLCVGLSGAIQHAVNLYNT